MFLVSINQGRGKSRICEIGIHFSSHNVIALCLCSIHPGIAYAYELGTYIWDVRMQLLMIVTFFPCPVEEVMKKVKCIRSQYSREKHKDRVRRNRSGGIDDIYNSRWLHYDRLAFLDEYLIAKRNVPKSMVS